MNAHIKLTAGRRLHHLIRTNVATNHPDAPDPALESWSAWGDTVHRAPDHTDITVTMPHDHATAANRWLAWAY